MGQPPDQECHACGAATSGYSRAELEGEGWIWHGISKKVAGKLHPVTTSFVMCSECVELYEARRKAKSA